MNDSRIPRMPGGQVRSCLRVRARHALALLLTLVAVWAAAVATLEALRPVETATQSQVPIPATRPRLSAHVLFVVVDGLRWDVAHDKETMPQFAAAMQQHLSGEIWASPISMTSSAVLAYGTGQRASLDQVLENLQPPTPRVNSWLQNAHTARLTLMGVGDPIWSQLYGPYFTDFHADPVNAAVERDFNAQTFDAARRMQLRAPDFLVVHFVTPDHQGHAYGIHSARYRASMRAFDGDVFHWLAQVPPDWTVLVTSDHGAADSGTHGSDTSAQRRSPLFAYGPGIRTQAQTKRRLDQVELPGLFAALLGVAYAEQSRGAALFEWLDVGLDARRALACTEIERLGRNSQGGNHPRSNGQACCTAAHANDDCVPEARLAAAAYDVELGETLGVHSRKVWPWVAVVTLAAALASSLFWGKRGLPVIAWLSAWLAASLMLTLWVERLAGMWPNVIRASLFTALNGALICSALHFKQWARGVERRWALAMSVFPGWLVVSYSTNTQVESYLLLLLLTGLLSLPAFRGALVARPVVGVVTARAATFARYRPAVVLILSLMVLSIAGTKASDVRPTFFVDHPQAGTVVAGAIALLGLFVMVPRPSQTKVAAPITLVMLCFAAQHLPLHWLGRTGWLVTALAAFGYLLARQFEVGWLVALASYAWIARDYEWLVLIPALLIAKTVGHLVAAVPLVGAHERTLRDVVQVTFLFALSTLLRIGLQGGLQLETLDLTVGSYGDANLPHWMSAGLLTLKFLTAQLLLLALYLQNQHADAHHRLLAGLGTAHLARGVCLLLMLFICGQSYWTAFRVVADLPLAWLSTLGLMAVAPLLIFGAQHQLRTGSPTVGRPP